MVINTNTAALNASQLLQQSSQMLSQSLARLSSGSKITSPADDSAGLAVSMELNAQMSGINGATNNINDTVSFNQTQDGYLQQVDSALNRMSELAVQAQDPTKTNSQRALYNQEYTTLAGYITDVASKSFNGVSLFSGATLSVTTDTNGDSFSNVGVNLGAAAYTAATGANISTVAGAQTASTAIQTAIAQLASDRANIGSNIETLGFYNSQLSTLQTNLASANSQIMDVNVAQESTNYAKYNILVQAGTAMLAQANALPNSALKLITG